MSRLSDELLMAYADGALPEAEAARVAAELETDAEARATVEEFRRTAALARDAFAHVLAEPVPDAIRKTVLGTGAPTANVTDLARVRQARTMRWRTALPLAASLALVIGLGALMVFREMGPAPAQIIALGPVQSGTPLADALESKASGTAVALSGRRAEGVDRLMVVATFRDRNERICREVEALDANMQPRTAGVACRDPARGTWLVEGTARIAAATPGGGSDFVPSGAEQKDALDGLLAMLGAKRALTAEEEQRLLTQGWRQ